MMTLLALIAPFLVSWAVASALPPLKIGVLNPFTNASSAYVSLSLASRDGARIAEFQANAAGGINGRQVEIVYGDLGSNPHSAGAVLDQMVNDHPELIALTSSILLQYVKPVLEAMVPYNLTMTGPVIGENDLHETFSPQYAHTAPASAAEITAILKELLFVRNLRRIGFMSDITVNFGNNFIPLVQQLLSNLNLEVVDFFQANNPASSFNTEMARFVSKRPQAVLLLGPLTPLTATFMVTAAAMLGPQFTIATISSIVPVVIQGLGALTPYGGANGRILVGMMTPSPDDNNMLISSEFRSARSSTPNLTFTDSLLAAAPHISMYVMGAWIQTRLAIEVMRELSVYTPSSFNKQLFSTRIYTIADLYFGVYAGECVGTRKALCKCNEGARQLFLANIANTGKLMPLSKPSLEIPVSVCDSSGVTFLSPVFFSSVFPSTLIGTRLASQFKTGLEAFDAVRNNTRASVFMDMPYNSSVTTSNHVISSAVADRIITTFTGSLVDRVPETPNSTNSTSFAPIIDPIFSTPKLYEGYRKDIIHLTPTLEQQLHALAYYASEHGLSARVFCASEIDRHAIHSVFRQSMDTFRVAGAGQHWDVLSGVADSLTIVLGLTEGNATLQGIRDLLSAFPTSYVALALADLELRYEDIMEIILDSSSRDRLLHVTNLPHWDDLGIDTFSLTAQYFQNVGPSLRNPLSIRGFFTNHFVHSVAERIPTRFTSGIFLTTLYTTSVFVLDEDVVLGPFYDQLCMERGVSGTCEVNIGSRRVYIRSLSTTAVPPSSRGTFQFESGRINYIPLPEKENADIVVPLVIGLAVGLLIVGFVVATGIFFFLTGKRNGNAPKDPSVPFTILFTDIQSSTSLWAEIPDIMAPALEDHHQIIRSLIRRHNGYEVKTIGDAFMIAFRRATDAVSLAVELQHSFFNHEWPGETSIDELYLAFDAQRIQVADLDSSVPPEDTAALTIHLGEDEYRSRWKGLRVRVGIHTSLGEIKKDETNGGYDYYGTVTNTAARTEAIAHGGQILATREAYEAVSHKEAGDRFTFVSLGSVELRGLVDKIEVFQVQSVEGRRFPSLRVERGQVDIDESLTDNTHRSSVSLSASSRLDPNNKVPPSELDRLADVVNATIGSLFSVYAVPNQKTQLKQVCAKWRLNVAIPRNVPKTDEDAVSHYLRALSKRLSPIIDMKISKLREPQKDAPMQLADTGSSPRRDPSLSHRLVMSSSAWSVSRPACAVDATHSPLGDALPNAVFPSISTSVHKFSISSPTSLKAHTRAPETELND